MIKKKVEIQAARRAQKKKFENTSSGGFFTKIDVGLWIFSQRWLWFVPNPHHWRPVCADPTAPVSGTARRRAVVGADGGRFVPVGGDDWVSGAGLWQLVASRCHVVGGHCGVALVGGPSGWVWAAGWWPTTTRVGRQCQSGCSLAVAPGLWSPLWHQSIISVIRVR